MSKLSNDNKTSNKKLLVQYASIGTQILAGLIVSIIAGKWIDAKLHFTFPVLIWLLPLIFIIGITVKVIKDTSNKKDE